MLSISNSRRSDPVFAGDLLAAACLVGLDVVARLIPHAPNFSPLTASAVFAGMTFRSKLLAVATPIAAMLLSDLVLGHDDWRIASVAYVSLALAAVLARWGQRFRAPLVIAPLVLSSSLLFFVTTNFAVWAFSGMYTTDLAGLAQCFIAALPFLQNTVLGDVLWATILFGGWYAIKHAIGARRLAEGRAQ
jgi:hypothetical protein